VRLFPHGIPETHSAIPLDDLVKEAVKVQSQIRLLSNQLDNPELELGTSMRLSGQRRELEAYLSGLLYALGEAPPWDTSALEG
jgi:hypothetical protein